MSALRDILRDADPLRHEPNLAEAERNRLRQVVVAATSNVTIRPSSAWFRKPVGLLAALVMIALGMAAVGFRVWSPGGATLQAAIRFEVRLAEEHPGPDLSEARVAWSDQVIYLHQELIVTNDDIAHSSVVQGDGPSRYGIEVQFNEAGAQKMREATAGHVGRPVAILIDGEVVTAPVLRSPISRSSVISGDYTKAEAQRIVDGIGLR
jgi:hypothetical protein